MLETNKIYLEDCLEGMKKIDDICGWTSELLPSRSSQT